MEDDGEHCPACRTAALSPAGDGRWARLVCEHCGSCWELTAGPFEPVNSIACSGCSRRVVCESRPTWLAESLTHLHQVQDGRPVLVRPLLYQDRAELNAGYYGLSDESRRFRFFAAPERLRPSDLEYLTNLDYRDHFAWAAFAADEPGCPGLGVARYIRLPAEPGCAEAAVTVVDRRHGCGIGTLLLEHLADTAASNGVTTFVTYVLWANAPAMDALGDVPARIRSDEPGVARLEIDLAEPGEPAPHHLLAGLLRAVVSLQAAGRSYVETGRVTGRAHGATHASSPPAAPGRSR